MHFSQFRLESRHTCSKGSTLLQLRLERRNFEVRVFRKANAALWQHRLESHNFSVQVYLIKEIYTLAAPSRKSQLIRTSAVLETHFGSSGSKVATYQHQCSSVVKEIHFGSSGSKVATFQYKCSKGNTLWQLRLKVATFQYKCSTGKTLWGTTCICWAGQASGCRSDVVLMSFWLGMNRARASVRRQRGHQTPAAKSQLFSTSVVGSSA